MSNSSILPIDRTLFGATSPSNANEEVLRTPLSSSITRASPSDSLVSNQDTRWGILAPSHICIIRPQPTRTSRFFFINCYFFVIYSLSFLITEKGPEESLRGNRPKPFEYINQDEYSSPQCICYNNNNTLEL